MNDFSQRMSEILSLSKDEAQRLHSKTINPEHLLLGIIKKGQNTAIDILNKFNVDIANIKDCIEKQINEPANSEAANGEVELGLKAARILRFSTLEARGLKEDTDAEHILLGILREKENLAANILESNNVNYSRVVDAIKNMKPDITGGFGFTDPDEEEEDTAPGNPYNAGHKPFNSTNTRTEKPNNSTPVLDNFGTDITRAAAEGKLDPVVGREKEIERISQILSRRKKNNPILIGEPGVGKSAIVEGLAQRIIERKTSRTLFDKRIVALDMTAVVAGTKYRGQFEERLQSIMNEMEKNPNIILFIDEIHTIVGAGSTPGTMDAANILKPALARGEIQCIGATTIDEYRKSIEKDGALERRFQKVLVEPTSADDTYTILKNIKERYESHHNVTYTDEALQACVKLTDRYITDRCFPDKAIDAMDEVGARMHISNINVPKEIEEQEALLDKVNREKNDAVKRQDFESAANSRDREKQLQAELAAMKAEWEKSRADNRQTVSEEHVANVVSMISGVPMQRMQQDEWTRLRGMKEELQARVIAQDSAIEKLTKAIQRSRVGLQNPNKPIGTFMFLGPTGVGKTLLAKELAKFMFGSADALIRVDMSEYMEKFTVSRLVGAPPGYVGYEEGGQLTEKVRRRPYSIVLLDEIEKAHTDVFNLLLQVMDEGRLTDSYGRTVDFRNTVLIMTSNVGTRELKDFGTGVGFTKDLRAGDKEYSRSVIQKALNKRFAPEFINRIDEIINFDQLGLDAIVNIVDLELKQIIKRVEELGYSIDVTPEAKKYLAEKGYDIQYGARPLKRALQTYVEDEISELLLCGSLKAGDHIVVVAEGDKLKFNIQETEQ